MKNNRYFRHDWGARNDPKILRLVRIKGAVAKAIYWDLIEMLYEEGGTLPLDTIEDVAFCNHLEDSEIVRYIVYESGLFHYDDTSFWSERQQQDSKRIKEISDERRDAGKKGGEAKEKQKSTDSEANAKQMLSKTEANAKQNGYNKIKENKIKDNIDIPSSKDSGIFVDENPSTQSDTPKNTIPFDAIKTKWNEMVSSCGMRLSKVAGLSEARKNKIAVRWKEMDALEGGAEKILDTIFSKIGASKYLGGDNKYGWKCSFDWLFENSKNWMKVYEGNYDDGTPSQNRKDNSAGGIYNVNDEWQ